MRRRSTPVARCCPHYCCFCCCCCHHSCCYCTCDCFALQNVSAAHWAAFADVLLDIDALSHVAHRCQCKHRTSPMQMCLGALVALLPRSTAHLSPWLGDEVAPDPQHTAGLPQTHQPVAFVLATIAMLPQLTLSWTVWLLLPPLTPPLPLPHQFDLLPPGGDRSGCCWRAAHAALQARVMTEKVKR